MASTTKSRKRRADLADMLPEAAEHVSRSIDLSEEIRACRERIEAAATQRRQEWLMANRLDRRATHDRMAKLCGVTEPYVTKEIRTARNGS